MHDTQPRGRWWVVAREPAVPVLLLAGIVQVYRAYAADIVLFFGTLALILWDTHRWPVGDAATLPRPATSSQRRAAVVVAVAFGLGAGMLPRTSGWLDLAFAVPGLVVLWVIIRRPGSVPGILTDAGEPNPDKRAAEEAGPPRVWLWPVIGLALALLELSAFLSQANARTDNPERPTISTIVEPWLDSTPLRMLALAAWLLAGWWLLRRVLTWQARTR